MPIPLMELPRESRRAAKARLVVGMNAGLSWREAAAAADITVREDTAYRLRRRVREAMWLSMTTAKACPTNSRHPCASGSSPIAILLGLLCGVKALAG